MNPNLDWLADEDDVLKERVASALNQAERNEFEYHWPMLARATQLPPAGKWRTWLIMAGRGFGKTRAGAEWVRMIAESDAQARIALISSSLAEARAVMVDGESGLISCCPPERKPIFESSLRRVRFPNGALAQIYSAAEPDSLRGPQHSHAWCDEAAKWPTMHAKATQTWDNLMMGLRLGRNPRTVVTTTPRAVPLIERLLDHDGAVSTVVSRGSTYDNAANLPRRFLSAIEEEYAGSRLARQEIAGELLHDIEGALWTRATLEMIRAKGPPKHLRRIIVAVDPPASANGDECGIVVIALDESGIAHVLADVSIGQAQPEQWAQRVAHAAVEWEADRVVAEANQGGAMVESVLRAADQNLPIKLVRASRGKVARAEPVAALYTAGRVKHCGIFPLLEDQLCGLLLGGDYAGPGNSPDRADALVWGLSELLLSPMSLPRVSRL